MLDPEQKFMKEAKKKKEIVNNIENSPECELASSECQDPEDEMCTLYSESPTV